MELLTRVPGDTVAFEERWTPTGPGVMRYEATITDPNTFTMFGCESWAAIRASSSA